jgi:capsular exopolysaccharide synthesis family protein
VRALESVKKKIAVLNQSEVQLRALERDAAASRTLLEILMQRTKQTVSQETFQEADADIVSNAPMPGAPSYPRKGIILPLTFSAALILGILLVFAIEKLDLGFRSMEQVERFLGVSPLGLIPTVSKLTMIGKKPHDYVLENPGSAFCEAIRSLYTNILLSDVAQRPKVIMVTSALPREGKTVVTLSLARMLSTAGNKVIVVDCDFRKPTVHKDLGIPPGPGLSDYLTGDAVLDQIIQEDNESGAHILRAGTHVQKSPDQLDSGLMQKLLKNLRLKYDVVILDSPPVLVVSDPLFIARLVDMTIFLVRWARTRRAVASLGLRQVLGAQANVGGVLLTMVDVKMHAQYAFGDSGSYYGQLKKYYTG